MNKILQIENLAVGYNKRKVVSNINQEIFKGQLVSILGPNGAGKTTILKTLAKLISPLGGKIYINGFLLSKLNSKEIAKNVAVVLTERPSPGLLTAFEFVALGRYPYTNFLGRLTDEDKNKIKEALHLVNADNISEKYFGELSDGEKQKIILARAIAQEPKIIILDEPTLHLDLRSKMEVLNILYNFSKQKGVTVIVSLHDIDVALKISDIVILVKNGRIIDFGTPERIINKDIIAQLYDLKDVYFNNKLYTIELVRSNNKQDVFVIAGGGTGTLIYRLLAKHGLGIVTGIIHENDIDYHVARSIGSHVISEKPFQNISNYTLEKAFSYINRVKSIIDSGFPVGSFNQQNIDLIINAVKKGKKVYTMRSKNEVFKLYKVNCQNFIYLNTTESLLKEMILKNR